MKLFFILTGLTFFSSFAIADELLTNCAHFSNPPKWLNLSRVNKAAEPIENFMEWSIRRVEVVWYQDQSSFQNAHSLGPSAVAVTFPTQNKIILGPKVTENNFNQVFGHELVHAVTAQKYKDAIPIWLEEGVANFLSKNGKVNYASLSKYEIKDVSELSHPMKGSSDMIQLRYQASQALAEMLSAKCDFRNLMRLSVQRKMQDLLENICRINDVNAAYKKWVKEKSRSGSVFRK